MYGIKFSPTSQAKVASTGVVVSSISFPYKQSPASNRKESRAPNPASSTYGWEKLPKTDFFVQNKMQLAMIPLKIERELYYLGIFGLQKSLYNFFYMVLWNGNFHSIFSRIATSSNSAILDSTHCGHCRLHEI